MVIRLVADHRLAFTALDNWTQTASRSDAVVDQGESSFKGFIEGSLAPVSATLSVLAAVVELDDYVGQLGWRVVAVILFFLCGSWALHCFTAKRLDSLSVGVLRPRYSRRTRTIAILAAIVALVPLWIALKPQARFVLPEVDTVILNDSTETIGIQPLGEIHLLSAGNNEVHKAGRFVLNPPDDGIAASQIVLGPKEEATCRLEFLNAVEFEKEFTAGDSLANFVVFRSDGRRSVVGDRLFDKALANARLSIVVRQPPVTSVQLSVDENKEGVVLLRFRFLDIPEDFYISRIDLAMEQIGPEERDERQPAHTVKKAVFRKMVPADVFDQENVVVPVSTELQRDEGETHAIGEITLWYEKPDTSVKVRVVPRYYDLRGQELEWKTDPPTEVIELRNHRWIVASEQ